MDKFSETYLNIIKQWYDDHSYEREQQAKKDRAYNKYIHTDYRDPQETNPIEAYQEWMGDQVYEYLNDDSNAQEINDQLDYNFSQEQWDALSPEEKTKEVIRIIIDKAGADPYELMDTYRIRNWEDAVGLDKESFKGWCDDLKTFANGEFNFFKKEQPKEQVEQCDGAAPVAGGPVGAPPPPPGGNCNFGGMGPAGTPPIGQVPPPPPPRRAGIHTRNVGALYVPTAPYGWWSRWNKTSTTKKKRRVKRRKKK